MKQFEISPLTMEQQVSIFYILGAGLLDDVAPADIVAYERGWHEYAAANVPDVLKGIAESGVLSEEAEKAFDEAAAGYKSTAQL